MSFEDFLFLALVAILFSGVEPLQPFSIQKSSCCYGASFGSKRPKVKEEMSKTDFKMAAVVAILDFLSVHLAILCLLSALMLIIKFQFNWIIEQMSKL